MASTTIGLKRGRDASFEKPEERPQKNARKTPATSALRVFQDASVQSLKEQFSQATTAIPFVIDAIKDLPSSSAMDESADNGLGSTDQFFAKAFQILPLNDLNEPLLKTFCMACQNLGISPSDLFIKALNHNNTELCLKLLNSNALNLDEAYASSTLGQHALSISIDKGYVGIADAILTKKPQLLATPSLSDHPLVKAVVIGSLEMATLILGKVVDRSGPVIQEAMTFALLCEPLNCPIIALLLGKTVEEAENYILRKLLSSYQQKLGKFYPDVLESEMRKMLKIVNSSSTATEEASRGNITANNIFNILNRKWPKEIDGIIPASIALELLETVKLARTIPEDATYAKKIADRIKDGMAVIIPIGFDKHSFHIVIRNGFMAICNRGTCNRYKKTIYAFPIKKLTEKNIQMILDFYINAKDKAAAKHFYYRTIPMLFAKAQESEICKILEILQNSPQKIGNCTQANLKLAMRVSLALMHVHESDTCFALSVKDVKKSILYSKQISTFLRAGLIELYLTMHPSLNDYELHLELLEDCYKKTLKHLAKTPLDLAHFPRFLEFKKRVDSEGFPTPVPVEQYTFTDQEIQLRLKLAYMSPLTIHEIKAIMESRTHALISTNFELLFRAVKNNQPFSFDPVLI